MTDLESRVEKRPELAQTQATRHPHWEDAINDIKMRFRETEELRKWAVEATNARLMGVPHREQIARQKIGEVATKDLENIWKKWGIEAAQENTSN